MHEISCDKLPPVWSELSNIEKASIVALYDISGLWGRLIPPRMLPLSSSDSSPGVSGSDSDSDTSSGSDDSKSYSDTGSSETNDSGDDSF